MATALDLRHVVTALRDHGVRVKPTEGWQSRGSGPLEVVGQLSHHTAIDGPATTRVAQAMITGRPDLSGPLANGFGGIEPDGLFTVWLLAGRQAHHAGRGSSVVLREFRAGTHVERTAAQRDLTDDINGNPYLWGWEWQHVGTHPAWAEAMLEGIGRSTAAFGQLAGLTPNQHKGHKHWTRRKIDPSWPGPLPELTARYADLEDDMPLTAEDKKWIADTVKTAVAGVNRNIGTVAGNQGATDSDPAHGSIGDVLRALGAVQAQVRALDEKVSAGGNGTGTVIDGNYVVTISRTE